MKDILRLGALAVALCFGFGAQASTVNTVLEITAANSQGNQDIVWAPFTLSDPHVNSSANCPVGATVPCALANNAQTGVLSIDMGTFTLTSLIWDSVCNGNCTPATFTVTGFNGNTQTATMTYVAHGPLSFGSLFSGVTRVEFSSNGNGTSRYDNFGVSYMSAVPLPAAGLLLLGALGGLGVARRRKSKA